MLAFPAGDIRTPNTNGAPYGRPWSGIARHRSDILAAAAEFGVPPERAAATVVVETGGTGDPTAVQPNASNGFSYGLMQIVPYGVRWEGWHRDVARLAGAPDEREAVIAALKVPLVNLRVGCYVLSVQYRNHGNWDKASSAFFLGNPDWRGWDTHNGNSGPAYRATLNGLIRELTAALPAPIEAPAKPKPAAAAPLPRNLVWVGTGNFHDRNGIAPVAIIHHVTDDLSIDNVRSWFQNRSSNASAHFVVGRDGRIEQFVSTTKAAWTNGDYNRARTDIPWLAEAIRRVRAEGRNLNDWTINVEYVGEPGEPLTEAQYAAGVDIDRYCLATYPTIVPVRGHLGRHADVNAVDRPYCPGPAFDLERVIRAVGGDPTRMAA